MKHKAKSMRKWYMDGYEWEQVPDKKGKMRLQLVYRGLYYRYETENLFREKCRTGLLSALAICILVVGYFLIGQALGHSWVGAISLILVIPAMYLLIGLIFFLAQKGVLTTRQLYEGYGRMLRSLRWLGILDGGVLICAVIYLVEQRQITMVSELLFPTALLLTLLMVVLVLFRLKCIQPCAE